MTTRAPPKQNRPPPKSTVKTPGKDVIKGDKQPTNILEIVPGKFNETDWLSLLESDGTEDFIADIFESIWADTSQQIQDIYIRRQLLPFTLVMTENALSSVLQWAFLEKDEPKPTNGDFWQEDEEPVPCKMDNWGEGVVPACREEHPDSVGQSPLSIGEPSPSTLIIPQTSEVISQIPRSPRSSSEDGSLHSPTHTQQVITTENIDREAIDEEYEDRELASKYSSTEPGLSRSSFGKKPYNHDVLVIQNQPPKLEPLSGLFYSVQIQTSSSSSNLSPDMSSKRRRRVIAPKASSQIGSDAFASTTNVTGTTTTKSLRKVDSKLLDEHHIEDIIAKAPAAAHSMLKSILNRPPGYRELELDDFGNVVSIARLDPDRLAPRSIRVKCDVVKPRKVVIEARPAPKPPQRMKLAQSEPKFSSAKLALPDYSSEVGDLIQPVPGVLYQDYKLKKGDPRRYQTGMNKYTNYYDETRPLRPIARRGDLAMLQTTNDILRRSQSFNNDDDSEHDLNIPKLHRLARIPPIVSGSSTSTA